MSDVIVGIDSLNEYLEEYEISIEVKVTGDGCYLFSNNRKGCKEDIYYAKNLLEANVFVDGMFATRDITEGWL